VKLAGVLVAVASLATVLALVFAIRSTKDDLPGDLRGCLQRGDATIVKGPVNLGSARREIDAGTLKRERVVRNGDDTVIVFSGQRFRLLVLANETSPPLTGDLPRRIYERADEYPVVAIEVDPIKGILAACAGIAAG
jgi:hypothetical protein